MYMTNKEMLEMRMNGATFQEIADACGTTKQNVFDRLKLYSRRLLGVRGQGFDISTIIYEGIYEYFKDNLEETLTSFVRKVYDLKDNESPPTVTMRNFLTGKNASRYNILQIKRMCEICGKPFEEVFKEREANDNA